MSTPVVRSLADTVSWWEFSGRGIGFSGEFAAPARNGERASEIGRSRAPDGRICG
jgi:hypothetical protein